MENTVYIHVTSTDPAFNLALEQYVFDTFPRDRRYFLFWQNRNAIIIGKFQNTLAEVNEDYVRRHHIQVVRRLSGGGAVYHDLGNLNYTWITDADDVSRVDLKKFCQPVADALRTLGANAEVSGRNDILIDGQKISGNAQYVRNGRVMHHGTLLFDSDLTVLSGALNVDPAKIQTKGIQSVRSRVTNIRSRLGQSLSLEEFRQLLLEHLFPDGISEYVLTDTDLLAVEAIRLQRYSTWDWNYGASPPCSLVRKQRIEGCGTIEAHIRLEKARIASVAFMGDFFSTAGPGMLEAALVGARLCPEDYLPILETLDIPQIFTGADRQDILTLLCQS